MQIEMRCCIFFSVQQLQQIAKLKLETGLLNTSLLGRDGSGGENVESTLPSTGLLWVGLRGGVGRRGAKVVRRGGSLVVLGLDVGRIGRFGSPSLSTGIRGRPCSSMGMKAVPSLSMGRIGRPSSSRGTTGRPLES